MSQAGALTTSGGGGGGVTSVSGTAHRITSTGGTTPVIDIAADYVGQTSLTTLGTITTGTWNATAIGAVYGGTGQTGYTIGDTLYASSTTALSKLGIGSSGQVLTVSGGLPSWATPTTGTVTSVSGTSGFITSTGGSTPVINIDPTYVGQASITTLGTIATGVWAGTAVAAIHGGTGLTTFATGDIIYASSSTALSRLAAGSNTQVLTLASGIPSWATPTTGTVTSVTGTANRVTSTGGATPVIDISASYVGQSSITTLGTITTGVWNGTVIPLAFGGTNANLTASNGGIFYSTASAGAILAGTATANQMLMSGASTTPFWSTSTYPTTNNANDLIYGTGLNTYGNLANGSVPGQGPIYNGSALAYSNPLQQLLYWYDFITVTGGDWGSNAGNSGTHNFSAVSGATGDSGHPGVSSVSTSTTTNGWAYISTNFLGSTVNGNIILGGGTLDIYLVCNIPILSNGTDTFRVIAGLIDTANVSGDQANGLYFSYSSATNSGNWQFISASGSTRTTSNSSTAGATGWTTFRINVNAAASTITYYINGSSLGTISTNIPTTTIGPAIGIMKSAGTNNRVFVIDLCYIYQLLTNPR